MVRLSDLGESGTIQLLQDFVDDGLLGRNEDAVAVSVSENLASVVNVDAITWHDDVIPQMSNEQVGKKLVAATVSDLAAKGCPPAMFLSSLNFPPSWEVSKFSRIARGISLASKEYGMKYLGGDLGSAVESPVLVGVAQGFCQPGQLMARDGIKPGDPIFCTGYFGLTGLAFANLFKNVSLPEELRKDAFWKILEPKAKVREGVLLSQTAAVTGSIDSSDGLAMSLHWLAEGSGIGIDIGRLPIDASVLDFCLSKEIDPLEIVFYGGEEFELVVALDADKHEQVCHDVRKKEVPLIEIGHATRNKGKITLTGDDPRSIEKRGWDSHRGFI
ncbi:MAG: thiamine-phosphate kinase [Candidatus Hodarchaeales archaeon]|jgi:thiamine-monophosphate kinase